MFPFVYAIEFVLALLLAVLVWTQLVAPLWQGRPLLPLLRRRARAERDLRAAQDEIEAAATERRVDAARRAAERIRKGETQS